MSLLMVPEHVVCVFLLSLLWHQLRIPSRQVARLHTLTVAPSAAAPLTLCRNRLLPNTRSLIPDFGNITSADE